MLISKIKLKIIFLGAVFFFLFLPFLVSAATIGEKVKFFIDPVYDLTKRNETTAQLISISQKLYFYVDNDWWNSKNIHEQTIIGNAINFLAVEFEKKIYPILTSNFGFEWKPGIDKDERITILIHPMVRGAGGYFNSGDGYPRLQNPRSNVREMVYLNAQHIKSLKAKNILAHEFMHLITFNQKERIRGVSEEVWLNEARAEYAPTLLGYDDIYSGSNLEMRVRHFLVKPFNSLTEWLNEKYDYGVINLFSQYLVDHYGIKILVDSLQSSKVGIASLNYALQKNGFSENFSKIFTDWLITVLVNDCSLGKKYCYKNPNLKNFKLSPEINFLPLTGESSLSLTRASKNWAAVWQKIIGGKGTLTLEFDGADEVKFVLPYLICDYQEKCEIKFLTLDKNQKGKITIPEFNSKYNSLTIIPSIQSKVAGFNGQEPFYLFSWKASIVEKTKEEKEAELIKQLLAQIDFLKKEIARITSEINAILAKKELSSFSCRKLENNLYFGMRNNPEVRCLQEFLKSKGSEIYPEGLVTGNFLSLTRRAVIRFQEKYAEEILKPLGLLKGTGYVGSATRAKINQKMLAGFAFLSPAQVQRGQSELFILGREMQTYDLDAVGWEFPLTLVGFSSGPGTGRLVEFSIDGHDLLPLVPEAQRTLTVHRLDNEINRKAFREWDNYRRRAAILRVRNDERISFSPAEEREFREGSSRVHEIMRRREMVPAVFAFNVSELPFQVAADGHYKVRVVVERGQLRAVWEGEIIILDVEPFGNGVNSIFLLKI